jgi:hypothetical protein
MLTGLGSYPASLPTAFGGSHTRACAAMLTQTPVGYRSRGVMNGISLDQIIANKIKDQTKFPSMQVGGRAVQPQRQLRGPVQLRLQQQHHLVGATTFLPKQVESRRRASTGCSVRPPRRRRPMPVRSVTTRAPSTRRASSTW